MCMIIFNLICHENIDVKLYAKTAQEVQHQTCFEIRTH